MASRQTFNRSVEEQTDVLLLIKEFQLKPFTGAENLHGQYEFVTLESMQKASDVVLKIIELVKKNG